MADIEIYSTGYGQKLQIRTWLAEIASATSITIDFRNIDTDVAVSLAATAISSYPAGTLSDPIVAADYGVEATIVSGWAATRIGRWVGQVYANFPTGKLPGQSFSLEIKAAAAGS